MRKIYLVAYNLRSSLNVGSLMRTAEGLGVTKLYLCGYTPYPSHPGDKRLPHIKNKLDKQIQKTALGSQHHLDWQHIPDINLVLDELRLQNVVVVALEQAENSVGLDEVAGSKNVALVLGNETEGVPSEILKLCDQIVEIPMLGHKESFNVVQAAAMALYHLRNL